jgi:hypothetical protein
VHRPLRDPRLKCAPQIGPADPDGGLGRGGRAGNARKQPFIGRLDNEGDDMYYELLIYAPASRVSDGRLPDRRRPAELDPRARRGRRRLFPVLRALPTRLLRTGPKT